MGCAPKTTAERATDDGWARFGVPNVPSTPAASPTVSIGALDDAADTILVEGTIQEVCQTKGCWMTLRDDSGDEVLVRFRDYAFFVPRNAMGRQALVTGRADYQTLSVEALRHLAEDAGKSAAEIAKITEPRESITFTADSVWIQGPGLADAYRPVGAESCPPLDPSPSHSSATQTPLH